MARSQTNGKGKQAARVEESSDAEMEEVEWSQTQKKTQTKSQKGKSRSTQAIATQNGGRNEDDEYLTYDPDMPEAAKRQIRLEYRQLMEATAGM